MSFGDGLEAGGEIGFPSILYGTELGGSCWLHRLLPTVLAVAVPAVAVPASSPLHKKGDRLFSCLWISIAALPRMCQCCDGEATVVSLLVPPGLPVLSKQDLSITYLSRQTQKETHFHLSDDNGLSSPCFQTAVVHLRAISQVFSSQLWDLH